MVRYVNLKIKSMSIKIVLLNCVILNLEYEYNIILFI